jgi:hypothetical protein
VIKVTPRVPVKCSGLIEMKPSLGATMREKMYAIVHESKFSARRTRRRARRVRGRAHERRENLRTPSELGSIDIRERVNVRSRGHACTILSRSDATS